MNGMTWRKKHVSSLDSSKETFSAADEFVLYRRSIYLITKKTLSSLVFYQMNAAYQIVGPRPYQLRAVDRRTRLLPQRVFVKALEQIRTFSTCPECRRYHCSRLLQIGSCPNSTLNLIPAHEQHW
jgi:hypothetical protein